MEENLTTEGIIFLCFAWSLVSALTAYCMYKVFSTGTNLEMETIKEKQSD